MTKTTRNDRSSEPVPSINSVRRRNPGILSVPATGFAGAPKDVQLMTRRDDLELSHGATAKVRENAVKQDRVRVTNAFGHHPERSGFLRRTEFIGGTTSLPLSELELDATVSAISYFVAAIIDRLEFTKAGRS